MFTVFDPRHFLGPFSYLSQAIKEVVGFIQTENLGGTTITDLRVLIIMEIVHVCCKTSHVNLIVRFDKNAVAFR